MPILFPADLGGSYVEFERYSHKHDLGKAWDGSVLALPFFSDMSDFGHQARRLSPGRPEEDADYGGICRSGTTGRRRILERQSHLLLSSVRHPVRGRRWSADPGRYLEFELEKRQPAQASRVYIFNTFFYERLSKPAKGKKGINYEAVERWTAKIDIFEYDFVVVPINERCVPFITGRDRGTDLYCSAHWYVAIICNLPNLLKRPDGLEDRAIMNEASRCNSDAVDSASEGLGSKCPDASGANMDLTMTSELDSTQEGVFRLSLSQPDTEDVPVTVGGLRERHEEDFGLHPDAKLPSSGPELNGTPRPLSDTPEAESGEQMALTPSPRVKSAGSNAARSGRKLKRKSLPQPKRYNPDK